MHHELKSSALAVLIHGVVGTETIVLGAFAGVEAHLDEDVSHWKLY